MNEFRRLKRKLKTDLKGVLQELPRENEIYVDTIFRIAESDLNPDQSKFNELLNQEKMDELMTRVNNALAPKIYIFARDYLLQKYYNKLRQEGINAIRAIDLSCQKFYISQKAVQAIIYGKKKTVEAEH